MEILTKFQAFMAFNARVKEADALFMKDGKRRFLIPFNDGSLEVLTKEEGLSLKKQGLLASDLTARTMYGACFYYTDTTDETAACKGRMPKYDRHRRREAFYNWFIAHHK